ncbi:MAG: hypothetical protein KDD66_18315 [Bdellovibrionales bacterium]|nr:hypothetical protein [Bdellovibrionales bacterium]
MLVNLQSALKSGHVLHAFRAANGLRVVRLETSGTCQLLAYGEHPHIEHAFLHADEDFRLGRRRYDDVYGEGRPYHRYPSGSDEVSSALDRILVEGGRVSAEFSGGRFVLKVLERTAESSAERLVSYTAPGLAAAVAAVEG